MADRIDKIKARLVDGLAPQTLTIDDESHQHAGHAGAQTGKGHFSVYIVSAHFAECSLLERHRLVYEALGDLMETDIHALRMKTRTPNEAQT